jgi:hypothetical protein
MALFVLGMADRLADLTSRPKSLYGWREPKPWRGLARLAQPLSIARNEAPPLTASA